MSALLERLEGDGPYTCMRCIASTWNDDDVCDACVAEFAKQNEEMDAAEAALIRATAKEENRS